MARTPTSAKTRPTALWIGVAFWLAFCVVAVAVRGVRWDETFEHAQVLARAVPYPEGHPLFRYTRGAFSVQTYTSALLLKLGAGPVSVCGLRNALSLAATAIPLFLLAAMLTGEALWGHLVALLALAGVYLEFDGSYPITVWPNLFSNGPIGGGYALLALTLLAGGRWRAAFLMIGLMPCVHIGQLPPLLSLAPLYLGWMWLGRRGKDAATAVAYAGLGLGLCAAFYAVRSRFAVGPPADGPYAVTGDVMAIWRAYTACHDLHRAFPPDNGHIALVGGLALTGLAAFIEYRAHAADRCEHRPYSWLFLYVLAVSALVWGTMTLHLWLGDRIPFLLIGWMPYRLINHLPPLSLAVAVALVVSNSRTKDAARAAGPWLVLATALFCAARAPLSVTIPPDFFQRYASQGEAVMFLLTGAALSACMVKLDGVGRRVAVMGIAGLHIALAFVHQFGFACFAVGFLVPYISDRHAFPLRLPRAILWCGAAGLGIALIANEARWRTNLPVSDFDRRVTAILDERGDPDALVVARPDEFLLQARTGHPVFVETATASLISYMPDLGPAIQQMYHDVYGIRFDTADSPEIHWARLWQERTKAEWRALGQHYGFRYAIAPAGCVLDLPRLDGDDNNTLYAVPADADTP